MKNVKLYLLCQILLFFSLPSLALADHGLTVKDFSGRTVRLDKPAERVVCLIESALSGLYMLGVQDRVVGISTNVYQEEAHRYYAAMDPRIAKKEIPAPGNWDFVSIESVVALQPDLVLIWASQTEAIEALTSKKLAVYAVELDSFDDVFKEIKDLGVLCGSRARATELIDYGQTQLNKLNIASSRIAQESRPPVYFMWAQGPLETSGAPSTVNDLINLAGGHNVASSISREHLIAHLEKLLIWQPQVIVMWYNPQLSPEDVADMKVWQKLPAAKSRRIYELPSVFYCDLWTMKFLHAVKLIASWCHPDTMPIKDLDKEKRAMLVSLYGKELGGRIPLDE